MVVDKGLRLLESLAILDYLEAAYPVRKLLPDSASELGKVPMVQMVVVNELTPKLRAIVDADLPLSSSNPSVAPRSSCPELFERTTGQIPLLWGRFIYLGRPFS